MNFLAHVYLSGRNKKVQIGNFIGDYVKGNDFLGYPSRIQKGIILHRNIDSFTDHSPITLEIKSILYPVYHKYAGIIVDIFYDHFLAHDWEYFSDIPFEEFVQDFYGMLLKNKRMLPDQVQHFLPSLIENNRLYSYKNIEGIRFTLEAMSRYTSLPKKTDMAIKILEDRYEMLRDNFYLFMPEIIRFVKNTHNIKFTGTMYKQPV